MARKGSTSKKSSGIGALGFTFLALIFTSATAFFLSQMMDSKKFQSVPMKSVVVAIKDISASDLLKKSYFKVVKLPINHIPENAFESLEDLFPEDKINKPRVLINKIYKNEVVLPQRLSDPKQGTGFASLVNQNTWFINFIFWK
jgi:Flp pilus assembly protein CpaB